MIAIDTRDFCIPSDENDYDELVAFADTIAGIQTHEVIPVDVLDKIKEEIEQIEITGYIRDVECFTAGINTALNVINKYRNEVNYEADN